MAITSASVCFETRSAVRWRVPVSSERIVGSGISCTFAQQDLRAVGGEDDRAVHLRQLVEQRGRVVDVELDAAREEEATAPRTPRCRSGRRFGAWTMLSRPSRTAVPGATISRALTSRGSCRASSSATSSPAYGIGPIVRQTARDIACVFGSEQAASGPLRRARWPPARARRPRSARAQVAQPLAGAQDAGEPELGRLGQPPVGVRRRGAARRSGRARRRPPAACRRAQRDALARRDARASAIARSAPGSSTRTPPATDTNTSLEPSAMPPWRASTASTSASRLRSTPLATRRGGTSSLGATSACTSTSSGREPSIAHSTTEPGARVASATKRAEASSTSTRPALAHLEHARPRWSSRSGS